MKFNSQPCTTKEQSERLLALRLKKATADCVVSSIGSKDRLIHTEEPIYVMESLTSKRIPNYLAWSLHRLIELLGLSKICLNIDLYDSPYEEIIRRIDIFINTGVFNREYLED